MQLPLHIVFRDVTRSDEIETDIRQRVAKLEHFHPRLVSCRVQVGLAGKHRAQGRQFEVDVGVRVPGQTEIVSNGHRHQDMRAALGEAFDSLTRRLEDVVREKRGDVKTHEPR